MKARRRYAIRLLDHVDKSYGPHTEHWRDLRFVSTKRFQRKAHRTIEQVFGLAHRPSARRRRESPSRARRRDNRAFLRWVSENEQDKDFRKTIAERVHALVEAIDQNILDEYMWGRSEPQQFLPKRAP